MAMKIILTLVAALLVCGVGWGAYAYYKACGGFNSCNNPVCKVNCYENGKRVR